ncbi:ABC transporter permease [Alteromonas oceanisediminis]|uniref:ABC transporter permease n=1 Tax=Alteromonas oceanisediminis TaxID=2836180 RepID=UPI001BDA2DB2|nr:FtsX-like permease family protein [Alteromonas oceanisediminis]MBT0587156.1 ABC transporter permease [Alteromonas oceanisediminis]
MNLSRLEIGPLWRALLRNKVGASLIAIQVAVTMAIVINSLAIVIQRDAMMQRDSGLDEDNTFYITSTGYANDFNAQVSVTDDLSRLREMPGIVNAIQINAIPISGGGWSMSLAKTPGDDVETTNTAVYMVDENALETLDLSLVAGREFTPQEIRWRQPSQPNWPSLTIITEALAKSMFDSANNALGQTVYIGDEEPMTIIGVVDQLQAPWVGWSNLEHSMLSPENMAFTSTRYLVRTQAGQRDRMMLEVEEMLSSSQSGRIIRDTTTLTETRDRSYQQHEAMITLLLTVISALLLITIAGIVGLASFSVQKRQQHIGTKRALGATQIDILRFFLLENMLISGVGIILGTLCTVGLNIALVQWFHVTPLAWYYIPAGALVLIIAGQVAVLAPAKNAASISPAMATRAI